MTAIKKPVDMQELLKKREGKNNPSFKLTLFERSYFNCYGRTFGYRSAKLSLPGYLTIIRSLINSYHLLQTGFAPLS